MLETPASMAARELTALRWRIHCTRHHLEDVQNTATMLEGKLDAMRDIERKLVRRLLILDPEVLSRVQRNSRRR